MEVRPDTSGSASDRFQDHQWSFLQNSSADNIDAQHTPSHHPSSYEYLRSDRSIVSPLPLSLSHINGNASLSRSSSRNLPSASTGARSTTSVPSQPVLLRINSENSHNHNNRAPRLNRRHIKKDKMTGLPALEEFSIQGILSAIQEDIEGDLNTIADIMGRSRFVLADQHESHMPPQGEITGSSLHSPLQGIDEAVDVHEALVFDDVMILNEDASLVEGSNSGSAAYGLLERLQAIPRTAAMRVNSDAVVTQSQSNGRPEGLTVRTNSSPAAIPVVDQEHDTHDPIIVLPVAGVRTAPAPTGRGPSRPVVSETYLDAEANGVISGNVPMVSEAGRHYPLYTHDDTGLFETTVNFVQQPSLTLGRRFGLGGAFSGFSTWFSTSRENTDQGAEARLRGLLNR